MSRKKRGRPGQDLDVGSTTDGLVSPSPIDVSITGEVSAELPPMPGAAPDALPGLSPPPPSAALSKEAPAIAEAPPPSVAPAAPAPDAAPPMPPASAASAKLSSPPSAGEISGDDGSFRARPSSPPQAARTTIELPEIDSNTVFTGALLKQVREARGIALKQISDRTRVGVGSLGAVEGERFEELPDARIYVRGFVRSLAVELGLDADLVSASYLRRWEAWYDEQKGKRKQHLIR
jgi:hypothetical protein